MAISSGFEQASPPTTLLRLLVVIVVAAILLGPIHNDTEKFSFNVSQLLAGRLDGLSSCLCIFYNQDHAVHHGGEQSRVGSGQHRRTIPQHNICVIGELAHDP